MATFDTSDFKKGLKIIHNTQPFSIVEFQHVKPGKGNAFTRTRIKNLMTGAVLEITVRSGEKVEAAEVEDKSVTYLYNDGDTFHFMDAKNYEQFEIQRGVLGDSAHYLLADTNCDVIFWNGRAIAVDIPQHMVLKVSHCEPGVRGDTATNVTKPATLETGASVNVPLFINVGDTLKIDTTTGKYLERTSIGNN